MTLTELRVAIENQCTITTDSQDTFLDQSINDGQADFSRDINWPFLETKGSLSAVASQYIYTLATNFDTMKAITWKQKYYLQPINYNQFMRLSQSESIGTPRWYVIHEGKLKIYPAVQTPIATTLLSAATQTASTSISLASTADLETRGRVIIDSEVIDYQAISSTQLLLCTRGAEDTTAVAHSQSAVATYRDIEYSYYKTLTDLSSDSDTSSIPVRYHEALVLYAGSKWWDKQEDIRMSEQMFNKYLIIKNQAKADLGMKQEQRFTTTLDDAEIGLYGDNTSPERGALS